MQQVIHDYEKSMKPLANDAIQIECNYRELQQKG